jgi:hypothetical protein
MQPRPPRVDLATDPVVRRLCCLRVDAVVAGIGESSSLKCLGDKVCAVVLFSICLGSLCSVLVLMRVRWICLVPPLVGVVCSSFSNDPNRNVPDGKLDHNMMVVDNGGDDKTTFVAYYTRDGRRSFNEFYHRVNIPAAVFYWYRVNYPEGQ